MACSGKPLSERSDAELVAEANRGNRAAMETLYYRYRDWVVSLAQRFCGNRDDALDVLQDTFSYFFRKFPGFELRAAMKTFLYPVVRNLSYDVVRKRRRMVPLDENVPEPEAPATGTSMSEKPRLEQIVAHLPLEQREVVLLRFGEDMKIHAIARLLSVPPGTVKSRLHNALTRLRQTLSPQA